MRSSKYKFLFISLLGLVGAHWFSYVQLEKPKVYIKPPEHIEYMSFGFQEVIADSLWIRMLQDSDYCKNERKERSYNSGTNLLEILSLKLKTSRCHLDWVYQMVDSITDLSPYNYWAYVHGATLLSIAVDDREGAKRIYDKGLIYFPGDWKLSYYAAYHYLFELQQPIKAGKLLLDAAKSRLAPKSLSVLAAKLFTKAGMMELAVTVLRSFIQSQPESHSVDRAKKLLEQLPQ